MDNRGRPPKLAPPIPVVSLVAVKLLVVSSLTLLEVNTAEVKLLVGSLVNLPEVHTVEITVLVGSLVKLPEVSIVEVKNSNLDNVSSVREDRTAELLIHTSGRMDKV